MFGVLTENALTRLALPKVWTTVLRAGFPYTFFFISSFQWFQQVNTGERTGSETQKQRGHSREGEAQRAPGRRPQGADGGDPARRSPLLGPLGQGARRQPPPPSSAPVCSGLTETGNASQGVLEPWPRGAGRGGVMC